MYSNYISHDHLKIPVYMHLYKAVCTVKLHFIYLNDIFRVLDIFITQFILFDFYTFLDLTRLHVLK
jgi:hypothetical protein